MEEYKIKQIIEKILKNQLTKKNVILMLDKSDIYVNEVIKILSKYSQLEFSYIDSDLSKNFIELDKVRAMGKNLNSEDDIEDAIEKADLILVPFLTRNTLAKVSMGIADETLTNSIQLALMMNKTIIALDSSCNPESENNKIKNLNLNKSYNNMLLNYKNSVIELGMNLIPVYELSQNIDMILNSSHTKNNKEDIQEINYIKNSEDKNINIRQKKDDDISYITKKDVQGKQSLHINKNIRLTNLAKEYILENSVELIQEK